MPAPSISGLELLPNAAEAYRGVLQGIEHAERSIDVRAFVWCDDRAGNRLAEALLAAAERGVRVRVRKDRIAALYEYMTGPGQSFFHKRVDRVRALQAWILGRFYGAAPLVPQQPSDLATALLDHPNVTIEHEAKRFDHAKVFTFDDDRLVLGSMGIGDNHHDHWHEMMVGLRGREHVERLEQRSRGEAPFDPTRAVDFLVHRRGVHAPASLADDRVALLDRAQHTLVIAMAYLGDTRFTNALVRAAERGVSVHLVTSRSDVNGHLNLATCDALLRRTRKSGKLTISLTPQMVHAKVVVLDGRFVDLGSANFTRLSHGVYEEVNVYLDDPAFAARVEAAIATVADTGERVEGRLKSASLPVFLERVVVAYQTRGTG
ncbi:MAG: phosphatidylserine/phosphatidylglycerophosphate/cardiolipin synthase family protein [Myxococcales bacterium]|nr:phosphatidylserine/phosphatidylglycerophosphate/cardiolipin synthase family protein [Myxococcales bacterium]